MSTNKPVIALVGYGKMGKEIAAICLEKKLLVKAIIDPISPQATHKELTVASLQGIDVVIDFTIPSIVMSNLAIYSQAKVNVVLGTTGWYDKINEVTEVVNKSQIGLLWSGNFSIGVYLFSQIIREAAKKMNAFTEYDSYMYELHHRQKADSPSGTAEMLAKIMIEELDSKNSIVREKLDRPPKSDELHVASVRGGSIFGIHTIGFDSMADTIELTHTARSRRGFAYGAVCGAEWIYSKKGIYSLDDFMKDVQH